MDRFPNYELCCAISRGAQKLRKPGTGEISGLHTWRYFCPFLRAGSCDTHSECSGAPGPIVSVEQFYDLALRGSPQTAGVIRSVG